MISPTGPTHYNQIALEIFIYFIPPTIFFVFGIILTLPRVKETKNKHEKPDTIPKCESYGIFLFNTSGKLILVKHALCEVAAATKAFDFFFFS